jgi:hypothetical protein
MSDSLPAPRNLLIFAVLLPAAVVGSNMGFLKYASADWKHWYYFVAAVSVAILGSCSGTYLRKAWLCWLVFGWSLVLLDFLVMLAAHSHAIQGEFLYVLVSAEVSLLALWGVLGPGRWQYRLPAVAVMTPLVALFANATFQWWSAQFWNRLMLLTAAVVAILCVGLRLFGFSLRDLNAVNHESLLDQKKRPIQFGMKHMLIWMTVTGPIVLIGRGIDIDGTTLFPALLLAASVATINLIAIWTVLGSGLWPVRLITLVLIPYAIGFGLTSYSLSVKVSLGRTITGSLTMAHLMADMADYWKMWMFFDAALLAALLLFLRSSGYRLARTIKRMHPGSDAVSG